MAGMAEKLTVASTIRTATFWPILLGPKLGEKIRAYVSLGVAQAQGMPVGTRMKLYCPLSPGSAKVVGLLRMILRETW